MSEWLQQALARAEAVQDSLSLKRQQSLQMLKSTPWPSRKTELWKYTSLRALEELTLPTVAANAHLYNDDIPNLDTLDVVFLNGKLHNIKQQLPLGVHIHPLADNDQQALANQLFANIKPSRHFFGLVNDVLAQEGVIVDIAPNAKIDKAIRLISIVSEGAESHLRVLINAGANSECTVLEQALGNDISVHTFVSEYQLGEQANVNHYRLASQSDEAIVLAGNHFQLAAKAKLNSTVVAFGSRLSRLDLDIDHRGEASQAELNGIYLLDDEELFDLHTTIEHATPKGQTRETVRGIVGGRARAVFNGRIHIHPQAQKVEAMLNNRNLLLSNRAEVDTKPELEIYADDVRCAHGATVSQIDDRSLYYLQSRGIDAEQAKTMLNFGFINELLDRLPHAAIGEWLRPQIRQRFLQSTSTKTP